ncbi:MULTISPECIES: ABC transporter ATP-binding protein [unclassified Curtobacterium]|uniref:dipeptide ABC transporter ATP-binding protein n=1 Tax=unclassified Curtobacterium TaxID=257496 RepID=UPI000DA71A5A|nr:MULTISPECIES: ABC transporter ATP-binding protein [unclassified Curtobacterium]WIB63460.1 ABC transporter ATP-binding protein [Curtobacterium sp. MCBD17_040]WIB67288.1 ABC transporter ATP-binding protein [Curtobacterium sp. MCBD17_035]
MSEDRTAPVLDVRGLRVAFGGGAPVVDDITFALHPGRVLALVGESGSGKSVSAMSVLGLLPSTAAVSGSIRFRRTPDAEPVELVGADADVLRSVRGAGIGTVFQEPMGSFTPVLSIGTQIAEAVRAHRSGADVVARTEALLTAAGIADPARVRRAYPHELSGGQLQRAMIAMALAADPVALIADEPTTALDVTVQAGILDLLRRLCRERDLAVLLITHDMGVVADVADDVLVMRAGRAVEAQSAADLFAAPHAAYTRELLAAVPVLGGPSRASRPDAETRPTTGTSSSGPRSTAGSTDREVVARLTDVAITYGGRRATPAVADIDLAIRSGEVLGLVGESGSGKSTIGRALAGLVPVSSGTVEVSGTDLRRARRRRLRAVRSRVGYVFQDPASSLNPRATIGWSIAEPLRLHTDLGETARRARVRELLEAVRLDPAYADRFPHQLSGGQRQRVAVARALALHPVLLIADEPTSALDVTVQRTVLDLLATLQAELGFACLLISHDLAVVRQLADEVVVLRRGHVVERGTAAEVLEDPQDPYTRMLLAAAPVADPIRQAERRSTWRRLVAAGGTTEEARA